jgi:predicted anti-sigma-YlaC factor YlaD
MDMKYDCDVIRDLLPLYQDDTLSAKSKSTVEEHFAECLSCKAYFEKMMRGVEQPHTTPETVETAN